MRRQTAKDGRSEPADAAVSAQDESTAAKRSRRDFFRYGGTAAAGALLGGAVGGAIGFAQGERSGFLEAENDYGALAPRHAPGFDHVVVVMGENRSFDNLLGYLYSKENLPDGQSFDGLAFGEYYNVAADGTRVDAHVYEGATDKVLSTSCMITAYRQDPQPSSFVLRRSHTHDMHQAGANGQGRMVNWTAEEIAADLNASGDLLGAREVVAYPFGHYNDTTKEGVAMAGYEMARTIDPGYVHIGTDKLALPVVRINYGMGLDALIDQIG